MIGVFILPGKGYTFARIVSMRYRLPMTTELLGLVLFLSVISVIGGSVAIFCGTHLASKAMESNAQMARRLTLMAAADRSPVAANIIARAETQPHLTPPELDNELTKVHREMIPDRGTE